jgi:hypothetical protein
VAIKVLRPDRAVAPAFLALFAGQAHRIANLMWTPKPRARPKCASRRPSRSTWRTSAASPPIPPPPSAPTTARGVWIPEPSGRIIALLGVTSELADHDVAGDGVADTDGALADLGITDADQARLATVYNRCQASGASP